MNVPLIVAGSLAVIGAAIHGAAGERLVVRKLSLDVLPPTRFGGREIGTALRNPDFVKFAESFGADATRVARGDDVGPAVREALTNDNPTVIEVPMDRLPSPF